ncbi:unnamed protein product [Orchesella dallaii]|uniref:Sin3 histone deacetylase corepressor complex component SDS3 n=1 Tax=Orchesella dallaii TaxID=48710 RepID=A0ABP1RSH3_9HEXA
MVSIMSPRTRTLSDSMDYDDELAELHDRRQSYEMDKIERPFRCSSPSDSKYIEKLNESDEDTEDASEDGDVRQPDEHQEIKEQVYYDKLALLKANLEELEAGNHIEYNRQLSKLDKELKHRTRLNEACRDYELECIEREYANERLLAAREFEDKKIELRESLVNDLEEKKKHVEQERFSLELTSDPTEVKPMSTRKLRRRPNEPVPIPEKRRKTPQSQITFLLDDKEVDEDLKFILKRNFKDSVYSKSKNGPGNSEGADGNPTPQTPVHIDARIEDGKLFYEKRWFHRGQPVFVEGKDIPRTSGIISGISQDLVWVRKLNEQTKIKVPISSLQKGKMVIKRRA